MFRKHPQVCGVTMINDQEAYWEHLRDLLHEKKYGYMDDPYRDEDDWEGIS